MGKIVPSLKFSRDVQKDESVVPEKTLGWGNEPRYGGSPRDKGSPAHTFPLYGGIPQAPAQTIPYLVVYLAEFQVPQRIEIPGDVHSEDYSISIQQFPFNDSMAANEAWVTLMTCSKGIIGAPPCAAKCASAANWALCPLSCRVFIPENPFTP